MSFQQASFPRLDRVVRPELLELLDRSRDFALTLVHAPAGSGKSTLLNQWQRGNDARLIARLSLGRADSDPLRFLQHLNTALRRALPEFAVLSCNALNAETGQADALAAALNEALNAVPQELFLLIDDFHYASAPLVQRIFARLLDDLPFHVHLIISSRSHPGFSLSRLKLEDRLLLIDSHDLRLPAEYLPALCTALGVPLPDESRTQDLLRLTEGWLAGLKLALLARGQAGHLTPEGLHGGQPELVDYFADVVLDGLPAPERDFLLGTAILDQFNIPLCESLLAAPDAGARLERILHQGLFLQPVDDQPGWFRYHPLFRRFLHSRLQQETPERLQALHMAAARHCLASGDDDGALFHACRAGCPPQYLVMLRTVCELRLRQGQLKAILDSLKDVDADQLRQDPGLFIPQLTALICTRQFGQARYCLDELYRHNRFDDEPEGRIAGAVRYLDKLLALFQDDDGLWTDAGQFLDEGIPYHDLRDSLTAMAARHHLLNGACETAVRVASEAKILLGNLGHDYLESFADVIRILAERELGHTLAARQLTQEFYIRHAARPHTPAWVTAGTCMAVSLYEQNRIPEARALCEALIQHVNSACATEIVFNVYMTLARLHHINGQAARGDQLLQQLRRLLRQGQYRRLLNQLLAEELSHALRAGNTAAVKGIAAEYDLPAAIARNSWAEAQPVYREGWVYGGIAAALYLRAQKRYDHALDILRAVTANLELSQMKTRQVVVEANRIVILRLQGHLDQAMQALIELFGRVGLQCGIRTIFDEAPGFGELVLMAHEQGLIQLPGVYLQLYADVLYPPAPAAEPVAPGPEPLTAKEQAVLALVRRGLSNKCVSRELNISLSTTKWHLKNIFAKLQVGNRTSAMAAMEYDRPHGLSMSQRMVGIVGLLGMLELGGALPTPVGMLEESVAEMSLVRMRSEGLVAG